MRRPAPKEIQARITRHEAEPTVSAASHAERLIRELGASLDTRKAVYLDTCYWIELRDAALGRNAGGNGHALLDWLRAQVGQGAVFCPISATGFIELLSQSDPACRHVTAALVDELSLGVSLAVEPDRMAREIIYFLERSANRRAGCPLGQRIWVRLPHVFGLVLIGRGLGETHGTLAHEKAFFDHLWEHTLTDMLTVAPDLQTPTDRAASAERLNSGIAAHADEVRSFEATYRDEFIGALDLVVGVGVQEIERWRSADLGTEGMLGEPARSTATRVLSNMFAELARRGRGAEVSPTLEVSAKCHAAMRWDRGKRFSSNTLHDIHHAMAVPYCDAVLLDKGTHALVTQRHVAIDKQFGSAVFRSSTAAMAFFQSDDWRRRPVARHRWGGCAGSQETESC